MSATITCPSSDEEAVAILSPVTRRYICNRCAFELVPGPNGFVHKPTSVNPTFHLEPPCPDCGGYCNGDCPTPYYPNTPEGRQQLAVDRSGHDTRAEHRGER